MAVTHKRYKFVTVSLPKRPCNGRFAPDAAAKRPLLSRGGLKYPLELLENTLDLTVFQDGGDGRGYRNVCKHLGVELRSDH